MGQTDGGRRVFASCRLRPTCDIGRGVVRRPVSRMKIAEWLALGEPCSEEPLERRHRRARDAARDPSREERLADAEKTRALLFLLGAVRRHTPPRSSRHFCRGSNNVRTVALTLGNAGAGGVMKSVLSGHHGGGESRRRHHRGRAPLSFCNSRLFLRSFPSLP